MKKYNLVDYLRQLNLNRGSMSFDVVEKVRMASYIEPTIRRLPFIEPIEDSHYILFYMSLF